MKQIGVAVVGAGRWGTHLIRNWLQHPDADLVAVVDHHADHLRTIAEQFALPTQILATDWAEMPLPPTVEAVAIVTPAATHYALVKAALLRGYHVLVEKPLTLRLEEALELCQLAEQQQRQLVVDHTYLFHPVVERGSEVMRSGRLGDLRYAYATRTHLGPIRQDVDVLWDLVIHDIAILNIWLGETPCRVQAQGTVWLQPHAPSPEVFPHGLSDLVWVTLTYPSGFQAQLHLCWLNPDKQRRLCVVGSQGTLIFDELSATPLVLQPGHLEQRPRPDAAIAPAIPNQLPLYTPVTSAPEILDVEKAEPLRRVCDHFLTCVRQNQPSAISSGWLGADLVKILVALSQSLHQAGRPVEL